VPRPRIIPCLLLDRGGLWKTTRYADARYVGDPINTARIFNEKQADELVILDIAPWGSARRPDVELIGRVATECFMPVCYGGGVADIATFHEVIAAGVEKVALNAAAVADTTLVRKASDQFGTQSVVVGIDVRRSSSGSPTVHVRSAREDTGMDPVDHAGRMEDAGAGELFLSFPDREGTAAGYDLDLTAAIADRVDIPVVVNGGAGDLEHLRAGVDAGASGVAAGSMFVFHGRRRAVLITYPSRDERASVGL